MDTEGTDHGAVLGAASFLVCFAVLTAERSGVFSLATSMESATVWLGAAVTVVATVGFVYRGGGLPGAWLLALGPSLAFTLNLFLPVSVDLPSALAYGVASGAIVATALSLPGYALGRVAAAVGLGDGEEMRPES